MSTHHTHASLRVTENILRKIFPNEKIVQNSVEFRIKDSGSIVINKETSQYYDFTNGEGGNIVTLYAKAHNLSNSEAYKTLASEQGVVPIENEPIKNKPHTDDSKKLYALKQYSESIPIQGTLAEKYLVSRCLNPMFFPPDFKFNEEKKCLIAPVKKFINGELDVIATHRIFLNDDATKTGKYSYGSIKGGAVWLTDPRMLRRKLFIAEGMEDALTVIAENYGISVVATTGASHLPNFEIPPNVNSVTLLRDNDDASERFTKVFAEKHRDRLELLQLFPEPEFKDFNEQLQSKRNSMMGVLYDH